MFGKRIVNLRKQKGMTQEELAKALGISRSALSLYEIEKREPDNETILKMATFFDVTTDYLLGLTDERMRREDLEWRYSHITNRFGEIIRRYRVDEKLSENDLSKKLNISEELLKKIEAGVNDPSFDLIKKISSITQLDIDYLVGANNKSQSFYSFSEEKHKVYRFDMDFSFHSRLESLCLSNEVNSENCQDMLGVSSQDFYDLRHNRMPTLPELLRISYAFNVSVDYLIGRVDNVNLKLSDEEISLLMNYRDCLPQYKRNIYERAEKLSMESINLSVAAEENSENKQGKSLA